MSRHIKLFDNHAQYSAFTASTEFVTPNVSACFQEQEAHYNPYVEPYDSYDYVEIGGIKWATMNIGANSITDSGLYFAWGDTSGYTAAQVGVDKNFSSSDYKYVSGETFTKYNSTDGLVTLQPIDDAATVAWGDNWRIPTKSELQTLSGAVNTVWTADYQGSGVSGLVMTDKVDSSKVLFFPAAGVSAEGSLSGINTGGYYLSSSLGEGTDGVAYVMMFSDDGMFEVIADARFYGGTVRAVLDN